MSQFPNMDQPGSSPNPFSASPGGYQPKKSSNTWLYILLGIGGVGLLLCCGCGGMGYFFMNQGFQVIEADLQNRLSNDPTAQQHLGQIQEVTFDFGASIQESEKRGGQNVLLFHVKGTNGSGDVIGNSPQGGGSSLSNVQLRLKDGQTIDLDI